ncbi:hypothetical protein A9G28_12740 [Gilliamella sp. Fer1-1]|jgi:hypothetical protein|uniref:hypothetical protein n=1 Tax=unclassified Gilliamella TaxID=2685620 RepID=UPI00080DF3C4|nr:hypothetical protein [Gilliamella apicola]OCG16745.1 hypothetical protein A9G47_10550 [Gilliamella apicola]OCG22177.1 hypothetical protein A9G23_03210 [Gilliamella apicola]OCG23798.1 hypothetical protein A9G46_09670 [Gilliamella apicola]OCG24005.1 hypothetical protein A9G22_05090 [Gilliamella apicola]OCG29868.1 hypothetical protein A9G45_03390 [Gilliamella apicola]
MNLNEELLELLRENAKKGKEINFLIKLIKDRVDSSDFNSFLVINYFMQAYHLSFCQIKELPGAFCMGGGVYSDEEINALIYPHIKKSL